VVPIAIAAALMGYRFVPSDYKDLFDGFCIGFAAGMFVILGLLYWGERLEGGNKS
jgi:hypothetical protein